MLVFYKSGRDCKNGHKNPDRYVLGKRCVECMKDKNIRKRNNETEIRYRKNNRLRIRLRLYNITEEQYYRMVKEQDNFCKICNKDMNGKREQHIDHCERTGKVRGLLCRDCNLGLGNFKHNSEFLRKAALYCEAAT